MLIVVIETDVILVVRFESTTELQAVTVCCRNAHDMLVKINISYDMKERSKLCIMRCVVIVMPLL